MYMCVQYEKMNANKKSLPEKVIDAIKAVRYTTPNI